MISAPIGPTKPEAGVIEVGPATMPVTAPTRLGLPYLIHSIPAQVSAPTAADTCVTAIAIAGVAVRGQRAAAIEAEPADPQHGGPGHGHPGAVRGDLLIGKPRRRPDHQGEHQGRRAGGEVDHQSAGEVHDAEGGDQPPPQIQWATGAYTRSSQRALNRSTAGKVTRSG